MSAGRWFGWVASHPALIACAALCLASTERRADPQPLPPAPAASAASDAPALAPTPTPSLAPTPAPAPNPALTARIVERAICGSIAPGGEFPGNFLATRDLVTSFVDGDDWLAIVNRSPAGTLAPDYAPSDLVHVFTLQPLSAKDCELRTGPCLRRDAATALKEMLAAFRAK